MLHKCKCFFPCHYDLCDVALADFPNFISPHTLHHSPPNAFSGPSHQACLRTFAPAAPSTGTTFLLGGCLLLASQVSTETLSPQRPSLTTL